jgi:pyruvate,water dikinase
MMLIKQLWRRCFPKKPIHSASNSDIEALYRLNAKMNQMVVEAEVSRDLETAIMAAWQRIEADAGDKITVAMRSSALGKDEKDSSFAGMHLSVLNVSKDLAIHCYKEIIASKYSLPAMNYRFQKGFRDEDIAICVGCLEMVGAIAGGVT